MAIADLILRYLQALVWPLAVLIIAVLFRGSIKAAVGRLTEVTGPGVSAKFETEAEALARQAKEIADAQPPAPSWPGTPPSPWSVSPYGPAQPYEPLPPYEPMPVPYEPPVGEQPAYEPVPPAGTVPQGDGTPSGQGTPDGTGSPTSPGPGHESAPPPVPPPPPQSMPLPDPAEPEAADEDEERPAERLRAEEETEDRTTAPTARTGTQPSPSFDPGGQQQPYAHRPYAPRTIGGPSPADGPPPTPNTVRSRVRLRFTAARAAADADPVIGVQIAWSQVARAVDDLTHTRADLGRSTSETDLLDGIPEVRALVRRLDRMRDDAAADPDTITAAAARSYVTAAEEAVLALYRATGGTP